MKYTLAGDRFLLLPTQEAGSYAITGYNWFDLRQNKWNSCTTFKTEQDAKNTYRNYPIREVTIKVSDDITKPIEILSNLFEDI